MKKAIIFIALACFLALPAHAEPNPAYETCVDNCNDSAANSCDQSFQEGDTPEDYNACIEAQAPLCISQSCSDIPATTTVAQPSPGDADFIGPTLPPGYDPNTKSGENLYTVQGIINIFEGLACWVVNVAFYAMVIAVMVAGIRWMMAGGDTEKISTAKTFFVHVLIGALVILGTGVIIDTVAYAVGSTFRITPFCL